MAGVSVATVSNAINGTKYVEEGTKAKIDQAIEKINYIPNSLAKSLKESDSKLIGLLISDLANPFFPPVVKGIEDYLAQRGYNLLLSNTNIDTEREKRNLSILLGRRIDGLLVSMAGSDDSHFKNTGIPTVFFNRVPAGNDVSKVQVDNFKAAYLGTEHLIQHGYNRIAIIAGPQDLNVGYDRYEGFKKAMMDYGRELDESYHQFCKYKTSGGYDAMKKLMNQKNKPDAVFTCGHILSLGALNYLKEEGYRIPSDIACVGHDDIEWAPIVDPPLSVIRYPLYPMGKAIGKMILDKVKNNSGSNNESKYFEPELIIRKSCGC